MHLVTMNKSKLLSIQEGMHQEELTQSPMLFHADELCSWSLNSLWNHLWALLSAATCPIKLQRKNWPLKNFTLLILKILTKWDIYMHTMVVYFLPFSKVVNFMGHLEKELRLQSKLRIKVFVNKWGSPGIKVSYWFNKVAEAILPCQHPEHIGREALL